ncbi:hypothetical protein GGP41_007731 [Bipolaris sorokiniana]|uniref:Uncharacterized protein n=1 Tax=Cochliobolus sativus TaxID=45130 RepID=A0A8H6DY60_COCSA|nr:hypothetical protein GGP41_007731 [Bipolaris sorokiniana]
MLSSNIHAVLVDSSIISTDKTALRSGKLPDRVGPRACSKGNGSAVEKAAAIKPKIWLAVVD